MSFLWGRSRAAPPSTAKPPRSAGGRSLALVSWDAASGKFEVGEEALEALRSVPGPVGVVAVCGRARQGKSYILNQLLGRGGGFAVDSTHRPCTKGLWIWSSPLERRDEQGNPYSVVLLDTEGIDAYDQTGQYSTQIFSLALLLSSVFVYNQMGGIDEAALDRLSLVTRMSEHIRVRSEKDGVLDAGSPSSKRSRGETSAGLRELSEFSPAFIWLLRDFYLRLEEDGRPVSPAGYLEIALEPVPGAGASAAAKNEVRRAITALFPDRDCVALVRPV
ncbi:guanylate-binding protein, partial [Helicosporidium sp. ATCC 50920]